MLVADYHTWPLHLGVVLAYVGMWGSFDRIVIVDRKPHYKVISVVI